MDGALLLGGRKVMTETSFQGIEAATGQPLPGNFAQAGPAEVAEACALAEAAFSAYSATSPEQRAAFLEDIADRILAIGDELIVRTMAETGLPRARLEGERGRTMGQLKMFARLVRSGEQMRATIDPALPDRQPMPRSDLRRRHVPLGPVAVFGASNFPLAFSVAGGDTASALAAGCPVVVKAHSAHPGASFLVGEAIQAAVAAAGLPDGVFALLSGKNRELGGALVADPRIMAVGFTGSRGGGLALVEIANSRPVPIPVYAEMSSINPVLLFPHALAHRGEALGKAFVASLTMGAGQFCTNPGLILAVEGPGLDAFVAAASSAVTSCSAQTMLTPGIHSAYEDGVSALASHDGVTTEARGQSATLQGAAALFRTTAEAFIADEALGAEVFGASSVVVVSRDLEEMASLIHHLEGQLTATLHLDPEDHDAARPFVPLLERKAGRILANGWPTGVEVADTMVHGGPFPSTSDSRSTSVGTLAIERFLRPVCYQDLPDALLPAALQTANPLGIGRRVDWTWQAG